MESIYFKYDGEVMPKVIKNIVDAQSYMNKAYMTALKLQKELESKEYWTGKSELVAEGFLDLMVQYQKDFYGVNNPQAKAVSALTDLQNNVSEFYENFDEYRALKGEE